MKLLPALALALLSALPSSAAPNVIFLMADDLGYGDTGFNGNNLVQTPQMDAMAREGLRFSKFYSVGPICSPTRACVQTGRHCMRMGMISVNVGKLPAGEVTLPVIARSKGYTTGHFGKWHLGTMTRNPEKGGPGRDHAERYAPPWNRGYTTTFATYTNIATWDPLDEEGLRIPKHRAHFWSNGEEIIGDFKGSSEKIIVDRALDFFRRAVADEEPFMATVWFYGPHSPVRAGEELRNLYPGQKPGRQHYLGSITSIDREVGRIRKTLEDLQVAKNTLILFCSDNGPEGSGKVDDDYNPYTGAFYGSAGGLRGRKRSLYNGGVRVPAFAWWPDVIKGGRTAEQVACSLDYLPTLADLIGAELPADRPIDGESFLPLLRGEEWNRSKFVPFATNMAGAGVSLIDGDYKLLVKRPSGESELYHIHDDPAEETNLIGKRPELADRIRNKMDSWLKSARHSYEKGDYPGYRRQGSFVRELGKP
jgi:arylsulfatase A-like enzyme